jgi:glycine/D-amino acid oxidase-like deaminating enzyme
MRKLDLRSGEPVWVLEAPPAIDVAEPPARIDTDVLVVGGGISGALVAERACAAGLDVVVVDRRRPLAGSTSASTALLQYDLDVPLRELSDRVGVAVAQRVYRRSASAVAELLARTRGLGIEADLEERDALYLEGSLLDEHALREEGDARRGAGIDVQFVPRDELRSSYGIVGRSALRSSGAGAADPRKLAAGFLLAAARRGTRLFAPLDVRSFVESKGRIEVTTSPGARVHCRRLVFATGYELPNAVPSEGHRICSTYAIATAPIVGEPWPTRCLVWEAASPYLYARVGAGNRVICGGEDEDFQNERMRDALLPDKADAIAAKLRRLLPALEFEVEFAWTASFGVTRNGTPTIGRIPGTKDVYAVLGYGGNGLTFAMIAAHLIVDSILGYESPDARLFAFRDR